MIGRFRRARPPWRVGVLAAAIAFAAAAGLAAANAPGARRALDLDLAQAPGRCGTPPGALAAGPVTFQVTDDSRDFVNVYLVDSREIQEVYAEVRDLAPHATSLLSTDLGAGGYAVRCVFRDGRTGTSAPISVTGTADAAVPGYPAMPDLALQTPVREYTAWVESRLPGLVADTRALDADVALGDLAAAKRAWLTAHLDYERLGAAYNAFGAFDEEIDGMANGLPGGVSDSGWRGFFAVEYALWHGEPAQRVRTLTTALVASVAGLRQDFPSDEIDPGDLPLRTHEILEDALRFQLSGIADYGSGTTPDTIDANTQGTAELLSILAPLIRRADPRLLSAAQQGISVLRRDLAAYRPSGLSGPEHQRLDADLGRLLETLSEVPALLYPRTGA